MNKIIPEFHGNPRDLNFNSEYVFKLKGEIAELKESIAESITDAKRFEDRCKELERALSMCAHELKVYCSFGSSNIATNSKTKYEAIAKGKNK